MDMKYDFGINGSLRRKQSGEYSEYYLFNAFNSMKAYSYNGERYGYYGYDASGERTYKIDFDAVFAKVGGVITVQALNIQNIFFYPNGYMNININGEYTKHYYADALRIASKIGSGASGLDLCSDAMAANNNYFAYDYLNERVMQQYEIMRVELNEVVVPMQDIQNIDPMPHPNFCSLGIGGQEPDLFFYHPDHLGSTGMVTDNSSNITQGMLYAPFGEIISDYNPTFHDSPMPNYAFNAKELDEENGMYYYSARYYAPPTFISRDPMFEKYPSISPYTYCGNNPIILIDPNGEDWFQNELTGEVYFNSEIGKDGAGTGNMEGDGWKWMGNNNMMGAVDNEFVNKYQSLAHEGGGTAGVFNVGDENGFHDGYEMNFGSNSEKFMNEMGYKSVVSQAFVYDKSANEKIQAGPFSNNFLTGEKITIGEKYTYVPKNYQQSGEKRDYLEQTRPYMSFSGYAGLINVYRSQYNYSSSKKHSLPFIGADVRVNSFYRSWGKYSGGNATIEKYRPRQ